VHEFVRKRKTVRRDVALAALVDGILALIDLQARPHQVTIQADLPADLPRVRADPIMIEQVLLNLARNGIEAMAAIAPARRVLRIEAVHDAGAGQVAVHGADHGHGIPQDVAERLFSPFFSTKAQGMGMGLNICRTAIEFHGGTLTHRDNPQGGTIFTFTLPASDTQA
jgi:two-component system sensor histidine kinase DctS